MGQQLETGILKTLGFYDAPTDRMRKEHYIVCVNCSTNTAETEDVALSSVCAPSDCISEGVCAR